MTAFVDLSSEPEVTISSGQKLSSIPRRIEISNEFSFTVDNDCKLTVVNSSLSHGPVLVVKSPQGVHHLKPATNSRLGWGVVLELAKGDTVEISRFE